MRRRRVRRADDKSVRLATPQPGWDYYYMIGWTEHYFCPTSGMVVVSLGEPDECRIKHIQSLGRAFKNQAEVNAYAAEHNWPNWSSREE